jgi:hypothetical protein
MNIFLQSTIEHNGKKYEKGVIIDSDRISEIMLNTLFLPLYKKQKNDTEKEALKIKSLIIACLRSIPLIEEGKL